jgi:hypothetical protein
MLDISGCRQPEISTLDLEIGFRQFAITVAGTAGLGTAPLQFERNCPVYSAAYAPQRHDFRTGQMVLYSVYVYSVSIEVILKV